MWWRGDVAADFVLVPKESFSKQAHNILGQPPFRPINQLALNLISILLAIIGYGLSGRAACLALSTRRRWPETTLQDTGELIY